MREMERNVRKWYCISLTKYKVLLLLVLFFSALCYHYDVVFVMFVEVHVLVSDTASSGKFLVSCNQQCQHSIHKPSNITTAMTNVLCLYGIFRNIESRWKKFFHRWKRWSKKILHTIFFKRFNNCWLVRGLTIWSIFSFSSDHNKFNTLLICFSYFRIWL